MNEVGTMKATVYFASALALLCCSSISAQAELVS